MSNSDFNSFADALPEALILLNTEGEILGINENARKFLLDRFHKLEDKTSLKEYVENSEQELENTLRSWARTRKPIPAKVTWRNEKNAPAGNWRCQGFMFKRAENDNPAQVVLRCIPGRGQLSEFNILNRELEKTQLALHKLLTARQELEKEHEMATVTLESIGDAVITTDSHGNIEMINKVAEELTGWTNEEAIGKPSDKVFNIINEITREKVDNPVKTCIEQDEIFQLSNHTILISRTGSEYVIEDSVAPIRNAAGDIYGAVIIFHDITGDRLARRQLEYLAQHDMLTSLNNRYYFEQELTRAVEVAKRGKIKYAMLYIDLDQFKTVNDTAGHSVGDNLLTEVAELYSARLRSGDVLARLGGDEFGVLLQNINEDELHDIGNSYLAALNNFKFTWREEQFEIHSSIGISIIDDNTSTAAEIMRQSDVACYVAKQHGRNRYHIYDRKQDTQIQQIGELTILTKINSALKNDSFILNFQPVYDCSNNIKNYYEVLIRLKDDEDGIIPPNVFIPIAERHAMMPKIDQWVIEQTFKLLKQKKFEKHTFSVNLSGASLDDKDILDYLMHRLKENKRLSKSIVFEITETSAVSHIENAGEFIRKLKSFGVRFALDDFGTGFSSFVYLKNLPIDIVKIDGLFVKDILQDPADLAMVRSINHIAHSLNKKTVAEYVESKEIQILLEEIGVDFLQGYHIGRPAELKQASHLSVVKSS